MKTIQMYEAFDGRKFEEEEICAMYELGKKNATEFKQLMKDIYESFRCMSENLTLCRPALTLDNTLWEAYSGLSIKEMEEIAKPTGLDITVNKDGSLKVEIRDTYSYEKLKEKFIKQNANGWNYLGKRVLVLESASRPYEMEGVVTAACSSLAGQFQVSFVSKTTGKTEQEQFYGSELSLL